MRLRRRTRHTSQTGPGRDSDVRAALGCFAAAARDLRGAVAVDDSVPVDELIRGVMVGLGEVYLTFADYDVNPLYERLERMREVDAQMACKLDDDAVMVSIDIEPVLSSRRVLPVLPPDELYLAELASQLSAEPDTRAPAVTPSRPFGRSQVTAERGDR